MTELWIIHKGVLIPWGGGGGEGGCPVEVLSDAEQKPDAQFFRRKFWGKCSEPRGGAGQTNAPPTRPITPPSCINYAPPPTTTRHSKPYGNRA